MKRKKIILYSFLMLVVFLFVIFYIGKEIFDINVLKLERGYIVKNEKGEVLDAHVYRRWNKLSKRHDLVLHFEKEEKSICCIFISDDRCIGLSVLGIPDYSYFNFTSSYLIQRGYHGYRYVCMDDPMKGFGLDYLSFSDSKIEFSTFYIFKKYGKRIVIEKH